ncbi:hypothetical protein ACFX16_025761 [Malus domestica]
MLKRRFYKLEHGDRDGPSNSSSSSSDSEIEPHATYDSDEEGEEYDAVEQLKDDAQSCSTSSGNQSEDSSANEVPVDSSGLPITEDDDASTGLEIPDLIADQLLGKSGSELLEEESNIMPEEESIPVELPNCIVKCKSAFKCRLCPRIVCLNEDSLRAHLKSKRHARSKKLLDEGRLKTILNADGKIDEEETPALYAKILANSQGMPRKKSKRQDKNGSKKRTRYGGKQSKGNAAKRRHG